jgi:hypothetical protein
MHRHCRHAVWPKYPNALLSHSLRLYYDVRFILNFIALSPILLVNGRPLGKGDSSMDWKKLLGSIPESVDEELQLRNAYLVTENRILRHQITGRVLLSDGDRQALAEIGQQLGRKALAEIATIAKPDTILAWHRQFATQQCDGLKLYTSVGRPRTAPELEVLVVRMARENRAWGYDRIVGALTNLGYTISDQTVGNILKRHSIPPAPERKKTMTWGEFIRVHLAVLRATDFFNSAVGSWCGLAIASLLCLIHVSRHTLPVVGIRACLKAYGMLLILLRPSKRLADVQRWIRGVIERRLARLFLCGDRVQWPLLAAFDPYNHREDPPQSVGKVVRISAVARHPIRDGPLRYRHQLDALLHNNHREAA